MEGTAKGVHVSDDPGNHLKLLDEQDFRACVRYNETFLRVSPEGVQVKRLRHADRIGGLEIEPDDDGLLKEILRQRGKFVLKFPSSIVDLERLVNGALRDLIYSVDHEELSLTIEANRYDENAPPIESGKAPPIASSEQLAKRFGDKALLQRLDEESARKWTPERIAEARTMRDKLKGDRVRDYAKRTAQHFGVTTTRLREVLGPPSAATANSRINRLK